jgi:hypothetical protein
LYAVPRGRGLNVAGGWFIPALLKLRVRQNSGPRNGEGSKRAVSEYVVHTRRHVSVASSIALMVCLRFSA